MKLFSLIALIVLAFALHAQTYTFTPAGATGTNGPSQAQINTAYASSNLNGQVISTNGIQYWVVPATGGYRIINYGAKGGNGATTVGGLGAKMQGDFNLTAGQLLKILVGQSGMNAYIGGGGGGSFVTDNSNTPLCVAGGGGGAANLNMYYFNSANASGTINTVGLGGANGSASLIVSAGGSSGNGGTTSTSYTIGQGSGGGGMLTAGGNGNPSSGGYPFVNGGYGGTGASSGTSIGGDGGFGGGGGGDWSNNTGAGGGGGYSGGGGGAHFGCGGGGGSYNSGANPLNVSGINTGDGLVIISKLTGVNISQTATINCYGQLTAALTVSAFGGQAPYTYSWSPSGVTSSTIAGLGAGTYTCKAIDAASVVFTGTFVVTQPTSLTVVTSQTNVACNGGSNGGITLNVSGGTSPYTYSWSPINGSTASLSSLVAGSYSCAVKDLNNCLTNVTAFVTQPAPFSISAFALNSSVCSGNSSTLLGAGANTYTWTGNITNGVAFTPTSTANYTVTGTNSAGCTATAVTGVTVNPVPLVSIAGTSSICSGNTLTLSASGATSYTWSNSANTATVSVSPTVTTTYSVTGINSTGCQNSSAATVTVLNAPILTANSSGTTICMGNSVTLYGNGATNYTWSSGIINNSAFIPSATAAYTVTGANACGTASASITITVNALPTITANASSTLVCSGSTVTLNGSGASSYTWSNGVTNNLLFSPTVTTTYSVTGSDVNGCLGSTVKTIMVNSLPVLTAIGGNTAICYGNPVTLHGSGANSYTWTGGISNNVSFSPTTTTAYTVTGTDASGCRNSATTTVTVISSPTVTANATRLSVCSGNSLALFGSGATSYAWSGGVVDNSAFSPTLTTSYNVIGSNGCGTGTAAITITVNTLPVITASASSASICLGGSTTLYGGGGITYTWSNGILNNSPFSPTLSSIYTVTGTDINGCQNTATRSITVNPLPVVTASASSSSFCIGNSTTLNGGGASIYSWSGGITDNLSFTPTITTTYTLTGTDANSCVNTAVKTITVNPLPIVSANASNSFICIGSTVTLTGSGASTYTWTGNVTNGSSFSPTATTTYSVNGTNTVTGCTSTNTAVRTISVNALPVVTAGASATVLCNGNSVTVNGSGANTYFWTNSVLNGQAFTPSITTLYSVSGTSTLTGCTSTNIAAITISVNALPSVSVNATGTAVCAGGSVALAGLNADIYSWTGSIFNGIPFSPTSTGTYSVTGTNTLTGCSNTTGQLIVVNALPVVLVNAYSTAVCVGDQVTLNGMGANTYTWNNNILNGVAFIPAVSATYIVTGTNTLTGCFNTATQPIILNVLPVLSVNASTTAVCIGNMVTFSASGASTYSWNSGVGNGIPFSPSVTAIYSVTGTNTLTGCTNTATQIIIVNPRPIVSANASSASLCVGATVILNGSGANTYTWTNGAINNVPFSPSATATYSLTGTNTLTGCTSTNAAMQTITVKQLPDLLIVQSNSMICSGETTTLTASGASSYTWESGETTSYIAVSPTVSLSYSVAGTSTNGCTNTTNIVQQVSDCTGVAENKIIESSVLIFPNPNNGQFTIAANSELNIAIINELGQTVKTISLNGNNNYQQVITGINKGIYFVAGQKLAAKKIVVTD